MPSRILLVTLLTTGFLQTTTGVVSAIDVQGATRLTGAQVMSLGGLTTGRVWTIAELDASVKKLLDTGLVTNVRYRLQSTGRDVRMTFEVEEPAWRVSVMFDNFIWMTDAEITSAIAKEIPTFDGHMPDSEATTRTIAAVLDRLLADHHIAAHAERTMVGNIGTTALGARFVAVGAPMPVCGITFPQATTPFAADLTKAAAFLIGKPYSRATFDGAIDGNILDVYRRQAYLAATFGAPQFSQPASATCATGVVIALPVTEGSPFSLAAFSWTGNAVFSTSELNSTAALTAGERASSTKLAAAMSAINSLYARKGYLDFANSPRLIFDAQAHTTTYAFDLHEGAPYTMDVFTVQGLSPKDTAAVTKAWPLKPGAPFDMIAARDFSGKILQARLVPPGRGLGMNIKSDRASHTVSVVFTVK